MTDAATRAHQPLSLRATRLASQHLIRLQRRLLHTAARLSPNDYQLVRPRGMNFRMYLRLRESPMMWQRLLSVYEPQKVRLFRRLVRPGGTVIDIGVNKGYFTLLAASLMKGHGRVFAIEPSPENCYWIRRSIASNAFANIELLEMALSDQPGRAALYLGNSSGSHSLDQPPPDYSGKTAEVQLATLDHLLTERRVTEVDLIKIDVEGAETRVLEGAEKTLARLSRVSLAIDVHPHRGVRGANLLDWLQQRDFRVSHMDGSAIVHHQRDRIREIYAERGQPAASPAAG